MLYLLLIQDEDRPSSLLLRAIPLFYPIKSYCIKYCSGILFILFVKWVVRMMVWCTGLSQKVQGHFSFPVRPWQGGHAQQLFHGPACHAAPVHLCQGTGDFSSDTVTDRQPLSHFHLGPCVTWRATWTH